MATLGLIMMAAGSSTRFGEKNKLFAAFKGELLIDIALKNLPIDLFEKAVIVAGSDEIIKKAQSVKLSFALNDRPQDGLGRTIKIGIDALGDNLDGYIFLVCDQPLLQKQSIVGLIDFWNLNSNSICALGYGDRLGNPVIFPNEMLPQFKKLEDKQTGRKVINENKNILKLFQIENERELQDINTLADLENLN